MTDLIVRENNLPASLEDLSKFVLVGREKLNAIRAEISAIQNLNLAKEVREQKLAEGQEIGKLVLLAEARLGELFNALPKQTTNNPNGNNQFRSNSLREEIDPANEEEPPAKPKPKLEIAAEMGFNKNQVSQFQKLADNPDAVQKAIDDAQDNDEIVTRSAAIKEIKSQKKEQEIEQAKADITAQKVDEAQKPTLFIGNGINFTPDEPYKLLLTDPPYSTDVDDVQAFAESWLPNALTHVRNDGFAYVFIGSYPDELRAYLNITPPEHLTLTQILVWTYRNTLGNNPKDRYKQNWQACLFYRGLDAPPLDCPLTNEQWAVQDINAPDGRLGNRYHSWQKPDEIAERFIRHSTQKGDIVFDPFACTGTFLLAAAKLGRIAFGFEINPDNAQIAFERGCTNGRTL
ncbi:MAG: site-specific DNA-methyltransferase [Selenomonadaceae bacterium]|nr:site-specific DNA-methyltransferase [Selenomonadaceae bacterium]